MPKLHYRNPEHDMKLIAAFLCNNAAIQRELDALERALVVHAGNRCVDANAGLIDYDKNQPLKHHKLLSGYFNEWSQSHGFSAIVKLNYQMGENDFATLLTNLSLFKDYAFRGTHHGEWTHLIQWWCIISKNESEPFLSMSPTDLYAWIGEQEKIKNPNEYWFEAFEQGNGIFKSGFNRNSQ